MTLARLSPVIAVAGLLAGCVEPLPLAEPLLPPPPPPPPSTAQAPPSGPVTFRAADFNWSTPAGRSAIAGRLSFGRSAFSCAGAGVVLTPETPWVRERMRTLYGATSGAALPVALVKARTPAATESYSAFVRSATCDAQSRFSFQGLPNGAWYLITVAHPVPGTRGEDTAVMRRIETYDGVLNVDL